MQKEPKIWFLGTLLILACRIGPILHILVDKYDMQVVMLIEVLGRVINYS